MFMHMYMSFCVNISAQADSLRITITRIDVVLIFEYNLTHLMQAFNRRRFIRCEMLGWSR